MKLLEDTTINIPHIANKNKKGYSTVFLSKKSKESIKIKIDKIQIKILIVLINGVVIKPHHTIV
jgi:hypothetical protein